MSSKVKMADVRSLLRNERAVRRVDHPQASYSSTGTLECTVCKLSLKSEAEVWEKHLRSSQHAMRAERQRISNKLASSNDTQGATSSTTATVTLHVPSNGGRKRKAENDEVEEDARKRTRPEDVDFKKSAVKRKVSFNEPSEAATISPAKHVEFARTSPTQVTAPPPPPASSETVDEAEWAAFEASVARSVSPSPPPSAAPTTALTAAATITAAPLTAAEVAARSREEASMQSKERREAEVEGEKEDAVRHLEEEFDEMEDLEERVRRLREQREALRARRARKDEDKVSGLESLDRPSETAISMDIDGDGDNDDDEEEDFDDWGSFVRR